MLLTFNDAANVSSTELHLLRQRAENQVLFDKAVEWMEQTKFRADIERGCTRNKYGVQSQFTAYDWADEYVAHPHFVFYDFFRGFLLNKYSRLLRGLDAA